MPAPRNQRTAFEGEQKLLIAPRLVESASREEPLLKGLMATGAGYLSKATGHRCWRPGTTQQAILVYCVKGRGWCELAGRLHGVRDGDLLILPPGVAHDYGAHAANPWTIHWAIARGENLRAYLDTLGMSVTAPVVRVGEDLRLALLFNDVVKALERGPEFSNLLLASNTLALLLAVSIRLHQDHRRSSSGTVEKVARTIVHMSEHLDAPPRVSTLAAMANLSQAHFSGTVQRADRLLPSRLPSPIAHSPRLPTPSGSGSVH